LPIFCQSDLLMKSLLSEFFEKTSVLFVYLNVSLAGFLKPPLLRVGVRPKCRLHFFTHRYQEKENFKFRVAGMIITFSVLLLSSFYLLFSFFM
jgi:hypothetical protein